MLNKATITTRVILFLPAHCTNQILWLGIIVCFWTWLNLDHFVFVLFYRLRSFEESNQRQCWKTRGYFRIWCRLCAVCVCASRAWSLLPPSWTAVSSLTDFSWSQLSHLWHGAGVKQQQAVKLCQNEDTRMLVWFPQAPHLKKRRFISEYT